MYRTHLGIESSDWQLELAVALELGRKALSEVGRVIAPLIDLDIGDWIKLPDGNRGRIAASDGGTLIVEVEGEPQPIPLFQAGIQRIVDFETRRQRPA